MSYLIFYFILTFAFAYCHDKVNDKQLFVSLELNRYQGSVERQMADLDFFLPHMHFFPFLQINCS